MSGGVELVSTLGRASGTCPFFQLGYHRWSCSTGAALVIVSKEGNDLETYTVSFVASVCSGESGEVIAEESVFVDAI